MSKTRLRASLALWRRRHQWRQRRLDAAHQANDKARIQKWQKLLEQAGQNIRRRESQLHPKVFHPIEGIDWAWGHANVKALQANGIKFACRYLSHDKSKNLTHAEAKSLSAAGINLVVVWETTANRAAQGHAAGVTDAKEAVKQAKACGMPAGKPIYFAVDFDGTVDQVKGYFAGAAEVLGKSHVGAYGGFRVIKGLLDQHLVTYGWQTYAWSGGQWDKRAHIQQYKNGVQMAGVSCDLDRAMHSNYGQWKAA